MISDKPSFPFDRFPLCLAPMAGFTDIAFRKLCKEFGCDITETEMVSAKGFHYGSTKSYELISISEEEKPAVVQIFGHEPEILAETAGRIEEILGEKLLAVDINMGCPAPKIIKNGDGSALLKDPVLVEKIVSKVSRALTVPVAVKIRKGIDAEHVTAPEIASAAEAGGASWVTVHGRTVDQMYSGHSDADCIAQVKSRISIPVFANGDVTDGSSAVRMIRETGCDGLSIGRGSLGNPWIFTEIRAAIDGKPYDLPDLSEKVRTAIRHAEDTVAEKGDHGIVELRKHIIYYFRGISGIAEIRRRLQTAENLDELKSMLLDTGRNAEYNI